MISENLAADFDAAVQECLQAGSALISPPVQTDVFLPEEAIPFNVPLDELHAALAELFDLEVDLNQPLDPGQELGYLKADGFIVLINVGEDGVLYVIEIV